MDDARNLNGSLRLFIFAFLITKNKDNTQGVTCQSHQHCKKKGVCDGGGITLISQKYTNKAIKSKLGRMQNFLKLINAMYSALK